MDDKKYLSILDQEWVEILEKLMNKRVYLTLEEEEIIKKIANKF